MVILPLKVNQIRIRIAVEMSKKQNQKQTPWGSEFLLCLFRGDPDNSF